MLPDGPWCIILPDYSFSAQSPPFLPCDERSSRVPEGIQLHYMPPPIRKEDGGYLEYEALKEMVSSTTVDQRSSPSQPPSTVLKRFVKNHGCDPSADQVKMLATEAMQWSGDESFVLQFFAKHRTKEFEKNESRKALELSASSEKVKQVDMLTTVDQLVLMVIAAYPGMGLQKTSNCKQNYVKLLSAPLINLNARGTKKDLVQRLHENRQFVILQMRLPNAVLQESGTSCEVCDCYTNSSDNPLLSCDGGHIGENGEDISVMYHAKCLDPPLAVHGQPTVGWFCPDCDCMVQEIRGWRPTDVGGFQYLVKWKGLGEPTWHDYDDIPDESRWMVDQRVGASTIAPN